MRRARKCTIAVTSILEYNTAALALAPLNPIDEIAVETEPKGYTDMLDTD